MSSFKFKELKDVADGVRFNDKYKHKLSEFQEEMRKLEEAILEANKTKYDAAIKTIRPLIKNKTHGSQFLEFDRKLKELESKMAKGAGFSCVTVETKPDEIGAVGGCKQSNESNFMECGPEKSVAGGRLQSSSSTVRQRRTESKRIKTETPRGPSSVMEVTDNDEWQIEIEKLNKKLENACKEYSIQDNTDKKSSYVGTKEKRSPIKQQFYRVNEQVDRIIEGLEMIRGMSTVKDKVQYKHVQKATESIEREAKARMETVIMWLTNVQKQIHSDKIDVLIFQLPREDCEEVKTIKACLEDICVKVKSISDKRLADENKRYAEELRKQDEMVQKLLSEVSDKKPETKNTISCLNYLETKVKEGKRESKKLADENKRYAEELQKQDEMIKKIWSEVSDNKSEKKTTMSCLNDLEKIVKERREKKEITKLSKMNGADSTIADLSDPYRATKLAEQFSELYDNSWIDAFKVLEIPEETECIQYLLNIVVESYSICADISRKQQIALATALQRPTEGLVNKTLRHDSSVNLLELQSTFSDLRKASAVFSVDDVRSYIAAKNVNWVKKSKLRQFAMSCIELCWFMHLQSPPVYLDVTFVAGSTFDSNKYKPYTKFGEQIDFIVFPSLLLHKGGPLLCKGVAQGKSI